MESREKLIKRLAEIAPDIKTEDIIVPFEYTLTKTESHTLVDGLVAVTKDKIIVFENNEKIAEYDLDKA